MLTHEQYVERCKASYIGYRERLMSAPTAEEAEKCERLTASAAIVLAEAMTNPPTHLEA